MSSPTILMEVAFAISFSCFGLLVGGFAIVKYTGHGKVLVDLASYILGAGYASILGSILVVEAALNAERGLPRYSSFLFGEETRAWVLLTTPVILGFAFGLGLSKRLNDLKVAGLTKLKVGTP